MYAIVKTSDRQCKVAEDDLVKTEKIEGEPDSSVALTPVLLVDDVDVIADADKLASVTINVGVVEAAKGPKICGMHCKNETGYKRRYGHRQPLTVPKITDASK